jgi:hypothetical protein
VKPLLSLSEIAGWQLACSGVGGPTDDGTDLKVVTGIDDHNMVVDGEVEIEPDPQAHAAVRRCLAPALPGVAPPSDQISQYAGRSGTPMEPREAQDEQALLDAAYDGVPARQERIVAP